MVSPNLPLAPVARAFSSIVLTVIFNPRAANTSTHSVGVFPSSRKREPVGVEREPVRGIS